MVASSILWPGNEDRPGPSDMESLDDGTVRCFAYGDAADIAKGALTLADSREHLRAVVMARPAGERTFYLDGRELFGPADVDSYVLPDGLHPDTVLYREIGRRFADLVFGQGGDSCPAPRSARASPLRGGVPVSRAALRSSRNYASASASRSVMRSTDPS